MARRSIDQAANQHQWNQVNELGYISQQQWNFTSHVLIDVHIQSWLQARFSCQGPGSFITFARWTTGSRYLVVKNHRSTIGIKNDHDVEQPGNHRIERSDFKHRTILCMPER